MCHQSVGLIQSIIEKAGIPTVSVTMLREITKRVAPPRALFVDLPLGYPLGARTTVHCKGGLSCRLSICSPNAYRRRSYGTFKQIIEVSFPSKDLTYRDWLSRQLCF